MSALRQQRFPRAENVVAANQPESRINCVKARMKIAKTT